MTNKKKLWIIIAALVVFAAFASAAIALQNAFLDAEEDGSSLNPVGAELSVSSSSPSDEDSASGSDESTGSAESSSGTAGDSQNTISPESAASQGSTSAPAQQPSISASQPSISSQQPSSADSSPSKPEETVSISFYDDVNQKSLFTGTIPFSSGSTAGDLTKAILDQNEIKYSITGSGPTIYFAMIDGLREKGAGPRSGWLFFIKEAGQSDYTRSAVSAGSITLHPGDSILWKYVEKY